jgi:hypothetical protein
MQRAARVFSRIVGGTQILDVMANVPEGGTQATVSVSGTPVWKEMESR